MKTAIVILNWNGKELLDRFLDSVVSHSGDASVVVADNGSTDGSIAFLRERFPTVQVIPLGENQGYAGGYNAALSQVEAAYYVLLNSDVEVTPGWLNPLTRWMEAHPRCAACQPAIKSFEHRDRFEHAGAAGGFIDRWGYPFCRGRLFGSVEPDRGQYREAMDVFWASGACVMVRADAFHRAGGFDPSFFAHMEEIDLCWRFRREGRTVSCIPDSVVYHMGGGTLPKKNPQKTFLNFRNNLLMLYKNLPPERLYRVLFMRLLLDKLAALKFLVEGDMKDAFAVWRAYLDFYRHAGRRRQARKRLEEMNLPYRVDKVFRGSLVFRYFIRRIRTFNRLGNRFS